MAILTVFGALVLWFIVALLLNWWADSYQDKPKRAPFILEWLAMLAVLPWVFLFGGLEAAYDWQKWIRRSTR